MKGKLRVEKAWCIGGNYSKRYHIRVENYYFPEV
jgi:hypothetical protein